MKRLLNKITDLSEIGVTGKINLGTFDKSKFRIAKYTLEDGNLLESNDLVTYNGEVFKIHSINKDNKELLLVSYSNDDSLDALYKDENKRISDDILQIEKIISKIGYTSILDGDTNE